MAEICCGVVAGSETSATAACEPTSRGARRRRMDIRRFRFVAGVATADPGRKRQKVDCAGPAAVAVAAVLPPDLGSAGVEVSLEGGDVVAVRKDSRSSSDSSVVPSPESSDPSPAGAAESSDCCPGYGMTSVRGRRRDMEDAVSIPPAFARQGSHVGAGFHFFGVYDGHGCSHVAVSCKERMHEVVTEELERSGCAGPHLAEPEWRAVMEKSFARVDAEVVGWSNGVERNASCRCEMQTPKCDHVGSTAVVAVVTPDRIVVANCGDSRAVLCRKGVPIPLSSDHKPDRPDELQRIQAAGGRVIYWDGARVLGVLAMSRAIGDNYLKPYVIAEPEVTVTERAEDDECLILASDGLWDVVTNDTACDIVRMCLRGSAPPSTAKKNGRTSPPRQQLEAEEREGGCVGGSDKACADAALLLTKLALARQSADNVSVVVVDLRRRNS